MLPTLPLGPGTGGMQPTFSVQLVNTQSRTLEHRYLLLPNYHSLVPGTDTVQC